MVGILKGGECPLPPPLNETRYMYMLWLCLLHNVHTKTSRCTLYYILARVLPTLVGSGPGPNHHSAIFTTTQAVFSTIHSWVLNAEMLYLIIFSHPYHHLDHPAWAEPRLPLSMH